MSENIKQSVRLLLAGTIDYAGLFPPSAVSMTEAIINYATYRNSDYREFLGRFRRSGQTARRIFGNGAGFRGAGRGRLAFERFGERRYLRHGAHRRRF